MRANTVYAAMMSAALSLALSATASAKTVPWIAGVVGYSGYGLSELNDTIDEINSEIYPYEMEKLSGGVLYGAQFGIRTSRSARLFLAYERLLGTSNVSDYSGKIEVRVPANCMFGGGEFEFPSSSSFKMGVGGAGGLISAAGGADVAVTGEGGVSVDYEGSAFLGLGYLFGTFRPAGSQVAIVPQCGYRYANISDPKVDNGEALFDLDYSGVFAKLVLRIDLAR